MSLGCSCSVGRRWPGYGTVPSCRLTVLVENRGCDGCIGVHGLAIAIEAGDEVVLLDTGPSPEVLTANAAALSFDLGRVSLVVLSHGHDDHSGGLPAVVAARGGRDLTVVLHPAALIPRFSHRHGVRRPIGLPEATQAALTAPGVTVLSTAQVTALRPGLWVTGAIPRRETIPTEPHLTVDAAGLCPDPFRDDQALVVETLDGLVVVCGCTHAGLGNTLDHITDLRPDVPVVMVVGGLHLRTAEPLAIVRLLAELDGRGVTRLAVGHCTGASAEDILLTRSHTTRLACGTVLDP